MLNSNDKKSKLVFFTNDVETTSLKNHCLSDRTGEKVLKEGMPILLEIYNKCNISSTFFFTGHIAEKFPEIVKMVLLEGHEIGCHGYTHFANSAFDVLNLDEQVQHLKKAKTILENISGQEVISFRAPALRVNEFTVKALELTGFKIDSSVAPQRGDMFFSFGSLKKLNWGPLLIGIAPTLLEMSFCFNTLALARSLFCEPHYSDTGQRRYHTNSNEFFPPLLESRGADSNNVPRPAGK